MSSMALLRHFFTLTSTSTTSNLVVGVSILRLKPVKAKKYMDIPSKDSWGTPAERWMIASKTKNDSKFCNIPTFPSA